MPLDDLRSTPAPTASSPAAPSAAAAAAQSAASIAASATGARVGCDVQSVAPVAQAVTDFGARYLNRIYTAAEQYDCRTGGATSLAGRFAAKEAVLKLLGHADGIDLRTIEILSQGRRPRVRLSGSAAALAAAERVDAIDISISHDAGLAFAVAVASPHPSHL